MNFGNKCWTATTQEWKEIQLQVGQWQLLMWGVCERFETNGAHQMTVFKTDELISICYWSKFAKTSFGHDLWSATDNPVMQEIYSTLSITAGMWRWKNVWVCNILRLRSGSLVVVELKAPDKVVFPSTSKSLQHFWVPGPRLLSKQQFYHHA